MLTTKIAIETLIRRGIREIKERNFSLIKKENAVLNETTLFTNKVFALLFLRVLIKMDNDLPTLGFFYQANKEALVKYREATKFLKIKIKKGIKNG